MTITVRAPAKINLHLGVGVRRPDGYHPLATIYQAIGLYDDVTVTDQPDWSVHLRGDDHVDLLAVPTDDANLALRAGRALAAHHGLERAARVEIHKGIPVAGGLAGGSADAAATLVALDRLWELETSDDDLLTLAAELGSDVPFALLGGTAAGIGRGEVVSPLPDAGEWWWVVVGSDDGLSTPSVYGRFDAVAEADLRPRTPDAAPPDPDLPEPIREALARGDVAWLAETLHNDLQEPALDLRPDLQRSFDHGRDAGALACLLSGSGPTVLLLAEDRAHAHALHLAMTDRGHRLLSVVTAPVAGAHVVSYA